jgi:hypothetical protein
MNALSVDYEQDYHGWSKHQVALLKTGKFDELDIAHLIEELKDTDKSNRRELESRFLILIAHLLKWQFQPEKQSSSWRGSIKEQRLRLMRLLKQSPSLRKQINDAIAEIYPDAVTLAAEESGILQANFPALCPYSAAQLLDDGFYSAE